MTSSLEQAGMAKHFGWSPEAFWNVYYSGTVYIQSRKAQTPLRKRDLAGELLESRWRDKLAAFQSQS